MGEFPELLASQQEQKVDDRLDSKVAQHQGYGSSRTELGELCRRYGGARRSKRVRPTCFVYNAPGKTHDSRG
ncbi:hypothetical protein PGTUg99_002211 [Puccinia graminis f. sp. tritici]|uniref:Uncharacterized protein n=1 Tax=Puccinia graminis f. sp. tritici TaxID=56615 RepID=A0A5B0RVK7_PUCGR|nr:hypothetical protein PGTUg99_002211 [Puccinia graminis f. sp. tritici]